MADYTEKLERNYQDEVVKLFQNVLGYEYLGNFQYARGERTNKNGVANSPIIESELKKYLLDAGYTEMQVEGAIERLKEASKLADKRFTTLMSTNNTVYEMLISGVPIKPSQNENERDVMFFDFENIKNNHFAIAEEVSYIDRITGIHSRPDMVVYVNGIALCVIELKRSFVSIEEGIRQNLSNEQDLIPSFFATTQFTVAAHHADHNKLKEGERIEDGMYGFKYATIGTPLRHWCPWKEDTNETGIVLSDDESYIDFFNKEQFMFLFRYGVLSDGGIKKVMRPHQYHAIRAAEPRLKAKKSGVIWHSQGSGKSLTMVWLASYIRNNFEDPRVVVITDRIELDLQLSRDFTDTGNNLHRAKSQNDLLETLRSGKEWLICTLIHKFGSHASADDDSGNDGVRIPLDKYLNSLMDTINKKYPQGFKAKGKNIFIFIDECHRTQSGRLHDAMRKIMGQDVMLIGFTGTPLLKDEKKDGYNAFVNTSEYKFGTFIHKYLQKQAVEDKVILDLQYEAREVEQQITTKDKLDKQLEKITEGLTKDQKELIQKRWATLEKVYSSADGIQRIGYSIIDDVKSNSILRQDWANAMLVAGNIYSAYKYYNFFQNECSDTCLRGRVAVVTSYNPSENDIRKNSSDTTKETEEKFKYEMALKALEDAKVGDVNQYEAWAKEKFVKQPGQMKLVIVVDKLLTGFDAPCATFLYIDKDMRDHTLFQAICRVNRIGDDVKDEQGNIISYTNKQFGLIIDFKHLFGNIENAITRFNNEEGGLGGYDAADIEGLLEDSIAKNKKRLLAADKAFLALKVIWEENGLKDNDSLAEYYMTDNENGPAKERRESMYKITEDMTSTYDNMADYMARAGFSSQEAEEFERHAKEASHINLYIKQRSGDMFDPRSYDPDMRALLDRYLRADDAEVIVEATEDFSFLDLIDDKTEVDDTAKKTKEKTKGSDKAAAEVIEAKARAVINDSKSTDPALYDKFSERLQKLLKKLHNSNAVFAEQMKQLIQLIKDVKNGGSNFPEGIDNKLKKALWNNRESCGLSQDETEAIKQIISIEELVDKDAAPGFCDPASADGAKFKITLRNRLNMDEEHLTHIYDLITKNYGN